MASRISPFSGPFGVIKMPIQNSSIMTSDQAYNLLKDPSRDLTVESLVEIFQIFIKDRRDDYYNDICTNPSFNKIPANGPKSLTSILKVIILKSDPDSLNIVMDHPNYMLIDGNSLNELLTHCLDVHKHKTENESEDPDKRYLEAIAVHPNVGQIPHTVSLHITALLLALAKDSQEHFTSCTKDLVQTIFHTNFTTLITLHDLGKVLVNACYYTYPDFVNLILSHPQAPNIKSFKPLLIMNQTEAESNCSITSFGITEAIFSTVFCGVYRQPVLKSDQPNILASLLNFVNAHHIPLDVNGKCGLGDSLTSAANIDEGIVLQILQFPGVDQIMANAQDNNHGGLDNALYNAARLGFEEAVRAILKHPNASQIVTLRLQECLNVAIGNTQKIINEFINARTILLIID